jgi:hypothetical protein
VRSVSRRLWGSKSRLRRRPALKRPPHRKIRAHPSRSACTRQRCRSSPQTSVVADNETFMTSPSGAPRRVARQRNFHHCRGRGPPWVARRGHGANRRCCGVSGRAGRPARRATPRRSPAGRTSSPPRGHTPWDVPEEVDMSGVNPHDLAEVRPDPRAGASAPNPPRHVPSRIARRPAGAQQPACEARGGVPTASSRAGGRPRQDPFGCPGARQAREPPGSRNPAAGGAAQKSSDHAVLLTEVDTGSGPAGPRRRRSIK